MSTIVTKYSDYIIQSVEFFLTNLTSELAYRDIQGLSNGTIDLIVPTKQHPLATLMASQLSESRDSNPLETGLLPAISVTPGNMSIEGFTMGQSFKSEVVDDDFIDVLKAFLAKTNKQIQEDVLITPSQIEEIISTYNRYAAGKVRVQSNEWHKKEEINLSVWSDSPDIDILLGHLVDSMLATIQVGFAGDNSPIRNFSYSINKGLTNFNFGRVLFGSEFNLTFLNSYRNYIIYTDEVLSGHDFDGTFIIPGETA